MSDKERSLSRSPWTSSSSDGKVGVFFFYVGNKDGNTNYISLDRSQSPNGQIVWGGRMGPPMQVHETYVTKLPSSIQCFLFSQGKPLNWRGRPESLPHGKCLLVAKGDAVIHGSNGKAEARRNGWSDPDSYQYVWSLRDEQDVSWTTSSLSKLRTKWESNIAMKSKYIEIELPNNTVAGFVDFINKQMKKHEIDPQEHYPKEKGNSPSPNGKRKIQEVSSPKQQEKKLLQSMINECNGGRQNFSELTKTMRYLRSLYTCMRCRELCLKYKGSEQGIERAGIIAHNVAASKQGPRGATEGGVDRSDLHNSLLLCFACSHLVDDKDLCVTHFPKEELESMKTNWENKLRRIATRDKSDKRHTFERTHFDVLFGDPSVKPEKINITIDSDGVVLEDTGEAVLSDTGRSSLYFCNVPDCQKLCLYPDESYDVIVQGKIARPTGHDDFRILVCDSCFGDEKKKQTVEKYKQWKNEAEERILKKIPKNLRANHEPDSVRPIVVEDD